jgi:hypothetical protein
LSTGLSDDQSDSIKTDQRTVDYYLVRLSDPIAPDRVQDSTDVQRCDIIGIKPKGSQSSADAYEGACYPFQQIVDLHRVITLLGLEDQ